MLKITLRFVKVTVNEKSKEKNIPT